MAKSISHDKLIEISFKRLDRRSAGRLMPSRGYLSKELNRLVTKAGAPKNDTIKISPALSDHFVTAAVDMWIRGVHSFLISSSLTNVSPIWSSVSGYYASHYCVRGLAHLLGFFQLYKLRRIIEIDIQSGKHYCHINNKGGNDGEHKGYWKIVKNNSHFESDPFFVFNHEDSGDSDVVHRNTANYSDHVAGFPNFLPLDDETLKRRITFLSKIELSSVPIPRLSKYPDVESIQLIAYHRLIKFRSFVDNIIGGGSNFWNIYRSPNWCASFLNFQVVEPSFITSHKDKL